MIEFTAIIHRFEQHGEKTGWSYIDIPMHLAHELKPGFKKSFRVKGSLDGLRIEGVALLPMGGGAFILPLNGGMRKAIRKEAGATVFARLEEDMHFSISIPDDLAECLADETKAQQYFNKLAPSHRNYFIKWIESAKTIETRAKRIANTVEAMLHGFDYGTMIRSQKNNGSL